MLYLGMTFFFVTHIANKNIFAVYLRTFAHSYDKQTVYLSTRQLQTSNVDYTMILIREPYFIAIPPMAQLV